MFVPSCVANARNRAEERVHLGQLAASTGVVAAALANQVEYDPATGRVLVGPNKIEGLSESALRLALERPRLLALPFHAQAGEDNQPLHESVGRTGQLSQRLGPALRIAQRLEKLRQR